MDIEIGRFDGEPRAFFAAGELAFGERLRDDDAAHWTATFEADRAITATDGGQIVGTAGAFSFELTVPGAVLPAAGVTIVGVLPTHRRRGILRRMMRLQLDDVRERGEPLAILWASEGSIYQRFGYGLGSLHASIKLARDRSAFRVPHQPTGAFRFVETDEARRLFPPVHDAIASDRAGFFARNDAYWEHDVFPDPEHWRRGASAAFHVVHETDGVADAYARYRIKDDWDHVGPKSTLNVVELMASTPAAHLGMWAYLLGIDLIGEIEAWNLATDDPLLLAVAEPRRLKMTLGDALWVRIVDVAGALGGRRYRADGRLTMELRDEFCDWNAGVWQLDVSDGRPTVTRGTGAPDIAIDTTDLAAAYLGAFSFAQLAAAGRVRELASEGVARADVLFRTDRAPWCPKVF